MFIRLIGRPILALLSRGRSSSYCTYKRSRLISRQPSDRMFSQSLPQVGIPQICQVSVMGFRAGGSSSRPQRCRTLATAFDGAANAAAQAECKGLDGSSIEVDHNVASNVQKTKFDAAYLNFFALTGILERPMASCRIPNGGYEFTITVYEGQKPGQSFQIEAFGDAASDISNNLDQLPQGALLSVEGRLSRPPDTDNKTGIKVVARFVGIIEEVPKYIAAAAAAATATATPRSDATSGGSAAVFTPGKIGMPAAPRDDAEQLWMEVFTNPGSFFDNRTTKYGRQPDFLRRSDRQALWIEDSRTPAWVLQSLQLLPGNLPYTGSREGSWRFDFLPQQASSDTEAKWMDVFNCYDHWWDNRFDKRNPRAPDFKYKRDGTEALWLDDRRTPQWVRDNIDWALPPPSPPPL